jgi:hypothetical protein
MQTKDIARTRRGPGTNYKERDTKRALRNAKARTYSERVGRTVLRGARRGAIFGELDLALTAESRTAAPTGGLANTNSSLSVAGAQGDGFPSMFLDMNAVDKRLNSQHSSRNEGVWRSGQL